MSFLRSVLVPKLVRLKSGGLKRVPIYLQRHGWSSPLLLMSEGLPIHISQLLQSKLANAQVREVNDNSVEWVDRTKSELSTDFDVVLGLGGGKALDVAKALAFSLDLPYLALPTSLSNDGFCSPNASLTKNGKRFTQKARLPVGVVVDLDVVRGAPLYLWLSGVGDLVAKRTAVVDWKLAFHHDATPFDDLAALLSDAGVYQFQAYPRRDVEGIKLLAQALLFNGVAMEIAGCSRPASGSEHLISHALDLLSNNPKLHGLQVGLATYWMGKVQGQDMSDIEHLFETTGFWKHWETAPMPRRDWEQALESSVNLKQNFHTVLSDPDNRTRARDILISDERLCRCLQS